MKKTVLAAFCSSLCGFSLSVWANEAAEQPNDESVMLDTVVVKAKNFSQQIGTQTISEQEIERRPTTNGNITDLLKSNPNVRFSSASDNSQMGGEIKPNEISFHGEKFYNNNFVLNGMSNNDNTHPGSNSGRMEDRQPSGTHAYDLPAGGTQSFWLDSHLLKSVEAFDSNIPARFGNFTGGVVDAKLKDPDFERSHSGKIYYRRTQDAWAALHTDNSAFDSAERLDFQPKFTKQQYGITLNQKFSEQLSVRLNYARTESAIAYYHPKLRVRDASGDFSVKNRQAETQKRTSENLLLNAVYLPDNGDLWRATLIYAPHLAIYFKANVKNGEFSNTGGGHQANLEWEKRLSDQLKMTTFVGYKQTQNQIEHQGKDYHIYRLTPSIHWRSSDSGVANAGGSGDYKSEKTIYTLKQDFDLNEFLWGESEHKIGFGWQADIAKSRYVRPNGSANYTYEAANPLVCNGAEACIDGEQYAWKKLFYYSRQVKAQDNTYSAYVEDNLNWRNLSLSLGLRYDYNQFLGKHNFAPRISGSYDLFGDERSRLFAGYNRYYAGSMLAYKLRQGISNYLIYERNLHADGTLSDWLKPGMARHHRYDVSSLKNPYSDEYVLGFGQKFLGLDWTVKWVHRNGRDQFITKQLDHNGFQYSGLTNDGWQKNDSLTFTLKPIRAYEWALARLNWDFGVSFNQTKTNNRWYQADKFDQNDYLVYNNKLYHSLDGLSPTDFNNPYQVFFNLHTEFPKWRLSWDQQVKYVGGKDYLTKEDSGYCNGSQTNTAYKTACGNYVGKVDILKDNHQASHLQLDWRFSYTQPVVRNQKLMLTLDINNVLNKRAIAKSTGGNTLYKMGRNFWAGASYSW